MFDEQRNVAVDFSTVIDNVEIKVGTFEHFSATRTLIAVTGTAVNLPTLAPGRGTVLHVRALNSNADTVYVGGSTVTAANGYELNPGETFPLPIKDPNVVFINGTAGDGVCMAIAAEEVF